MTTQTQCDRIFAKFGGVPRLCEALLGVGKPRNVSTVYRWNLPRPGGSGGVVPATAVDDVMAAADHAKVKLTDQDWSPRRG